jgi:hypothetical protein
MKATKLADKIWYFEDVIPDAKEIFAKIEGWKPLENQQFMETTQDSTKKFLEATDNATFRVLDVWYRENKDLFDGDYKLLIDTAYYRRGAGLGYSPHIDFAANPTDRTYVDVHATILGYFSDPSEYEGGEIYFDDYDIYVKPALGSMIIFGHKVMHGVTEVTSGTRTLSSQFLVSNKDYNKIMDIDPETITKERKIWLRNESPQYENKNANAFYDYDTM